MTATTLDNQRQSFCKKGGLTTEEREAVERAVKDFIVTENSDEDEESVPETRQKWGANVTNPGDADSPTREGPVPAFSVADILIEIYVGKTFTKCNEELLVAFHLWKYRPLEDRERTKTFALNGENKTILEAIDVALGEIIQEHEGG